MKLTRQEHADLIAHVKLAEDLFGSQGLVMKSSGDMDAFAAFIADKEHSGGLSESHDPAHCHLTPDNSFWIWLETADGEKVACATQKIVETESFIGEIFSYRLYDSLSPVIERRLPEFHDGADEDEFHFAGKVVYGSGLYVHPDYRGRGFMMLGRVSRTLALGHYGADWFVGIQRLTNASHDHVVKRQQYATVRPFLKGMPHKWDGSFQIGYSTGREWLTAVQTELRNAGQHQQGSSRDQGRRIAAEEDARSPA